MAETSSELCSQNKTAGSCFPSLIVAKTQFLSQFLAPLTSSGTTYPYTSKPATNTAVALNLSEMETKVREATNNEPWGCPTSLMAQIAAGTYNYREREEILSFIFRRFTEKAANEWRQIYKSLQLLDYLVKHGFERIIDDIRANISLIQMLKSFHYIDSKGRDQGINVRNRSKNLVNLLNDDTTVRLERKKAQANAKKFGANSHSSSEGYEGSFIAVYGGGGDEDFNNRVYGDGGVFGARYDDPADAYRNGATGRSNFEEYNVENTLAPHTCKATTVSSGAHAGASTLSKKSKPQPVVPEQDLLGDVMDFSSNHQPVTAQPTTDAANNNGGDDDDDDFDDFQSAPSLSRNTSSLTNNLANLYVSQPPSTQPAQRELPAQTSQPSFHTANRVSSGPAKPSGDAFSSLFSSAKSKTSTASKNKVNAKPTQNRTDLFSGVAANKPAATPAPSTTQAQNSGEIDLLSF